MEHGQVDDSSQMPEVALFDAAEFARRIGMSEDWVRRNAKSGMRLHHHRVGRLLRFSEDSVNDFKARTAVPPPPPLDPLRRTERSQRLRRK